MDDPLDRIYVLKNPVMEYAWGSESFIPELLGITPQKNRPCAELWMGAHPNAPSCIFWSGQWVSLGEICRKRGEDLLGRSVAAGFSGGFPFLFKVLAAARPLSIQVHPDKARARLGFLRENGRNIRPAAPNRSYKDPNHKPELICALTPFRALKGFRPINEILDLASRLESRSMDRTLKPLRLNPDPEGLRAFFAGIMDMAQEDRCELIREIGEACQRRSNEQSEFRWIEILVRDYPGDAGILAPLFMNLFCLRPGEALFIRPGEIHAYLEGAGIELMANSDNVLRCGLTPKYIDRAELMEVVRFEPANSGIIRPAESGLERVYPSDADEFRLSSINLHGGVVYAGGAERAVELMLCTDGEVRVIDPGRGESLDLARGGSVVIPAAVKDYRIEGEGTLYKATVPI